MIHSIHFYEYLSKHCEATKDIILLTFAIQLLSCYSTYFWNLWLSAPIYAFYKAWVNYIWPWFTAAPAELTDQEKKRLAKKEKKREKMQYKFR